MTLRSTVPAITPPAWSSFATGVPPSEHGVFGFQYPDPGDYSLQLTSFGDLQRPTLWRRLSDCGHRVLLIDVPFTFPPEAVNGCLIAGFPLPAAGDFTHPPDLARTLESEGVGCPRHPIEVPDPATHGFLDWVDAFASDRVRLFRHLAAAEPWQFAMIGTMAVDWAQHALWRYYDRRFVFATEPEAPERREALFACYRRVDRFVGDLAEIAGEEAMIILASDHGFATTFHYDWVVEALHEADLLHWRGGRKGLAAKMGAAALQAARSSPRLQRWGKRLLGDTAAARTWARRARDYSAIDWARTRVFAAGDYHLNLYVNGRSRFARGIVEDGPEYEAVLDAAVEALQAFRPPRHDRPLLRRIVRIEGGAQGLATRTPDLSLEMNTLPVAIDSAAVAPLAGICGFHSPEGICLSSTAALFDTDRGTELEITELAPAILKYFGVPFDRRDRVVPPGPSQVFSTEQAAAVLDSLRHLGYLD